jgi:hypothetical protein
MPTGNAAKKPHFFNKLRAAAEATLRDALWCGITSAR